MFATVIAETDCVGGRKTDFSNAGCSMARALGLIGDPWSLLIVRDALRGVRRYGAFQKSLGLAKNILADRLRKLVAAGVLEVHPTTGGSTRNEYVLTEKGERLSVVLVAVAHWGESYAFAPDEERPQVVDRRDRRPVRVLALAEDGRQLGPGDTIVVAVRPAAPVTLDDPSPSGLTT